MTTDLAGNGVPGAASRAPELARKGLHVAMGGFAFLLAWLTWWQAALCALAALLNNLFVLPRIGGRRVFRGRAALAGHDLGIVLYPCSVLLLILLFPARLDIVAGAWGLLAFGDGLATVAGITLGRATGCLPWNRDKSWAGLAGFLAGGVPMTLTLVAWTRGTPLAPAEIALFAAVAVVVAIIETLPAGIDDNLLVPFSGAGLLFAATLVEPLRVAAEAPLLGARLLPALVVNVALALTAYALRSVDVSGVVHGVVLGTVTWVFGGGAAFVILLLFFVLGTGATKVGYRTKAREGTAQAKGGRRGARHAWANGGAPMLFALLYGTTGAADLAPLFALAFVAALATASSDTLASEIGQAFGRRTYLVTTFRPVPRGTDGAVSLEGTLAGIAGSLVVGGVAHALGIIDAWGVLWTVIAAFAGTTLESVLGAWLERANKIDNEAQNFLNTLVGGLVALGLARLVR